jgi:hypothetical protein
MFKDKKYFDIKHIMECAICLEEGKLIVFNHNGECGDMNVHDSCLTKWFIANDNECIICRKNLITDYELLSSEEENSVNSIDIIIHNNNHIFSENFIDYLCKILFMLFIFSIILFLILLFSGFFNARVH